MVAFVWYKEKCRLKWLKCHFTLATHPFKSFSFISVSICTGQVCSHSSFSHFSPRRALAHFHKHHMDTQYKKKRCRSPPQTIHGWQKFGFLSPSAAAGPSAAAHKSSLGTAWYVPMILPLLLQHAASTVVSLQHGFQHRQSYMHTQVCIYRHTYMYVTCAIQ